MKVIRKVEIKNFRSFLGTTVSDRAEILSITDLNIFSGSNDSGKSNLLRALNLFFNDEIDNVNKFRFNSDFNVFKQDTVQKVIEIKIYFIVNKRKFSISKFYNRDGYRNFEYSFTEKDSDEEIVIDSRPNTNKTRYKDNEAVLKKESGYKRAATRAMQSVSFSYVPAIREAQFFSHLYGKIIYKIKQNEERLIENLSTEYKKIERWERTQKNKSEKQDFLENLEDEAWREARLIEIDNQISGISSLDDAIKELESQINTFSDNLFSSVEFLSSKFKVGSDLIAFFESFDIGTGGEKDLSLRLRGDGVQARFIPEMLNFMDSISTEKKYFIWGFEEPENSAEYKNQQILAKKLKDIFSKEKQIFLTTHSEEFLSIYDGSDVNKDKRTANLYHVKKNIKKVKEANKEIEYSTVKQFDVDNQSFDFATVKSDLENDIGTSLIRAKYSKELKEKENEFIAKMEQFEEEKISLREQYEKTSKWLLFVEDKCDQIYKVAYLKAKNIDFTENNFIATFNEHSPFDIYPKNGQIELNKMLDQAAITEWQGKRIVGLFDFDEAFTKFNGLKAYRWENIEGDEITCLYRKRKDHEYFYALVLPVPDFRSHYANKSLGDKSQLEVELLFTDDVLNSIDSKKDVPIAGVSATITAFKGEKAKFWKKLVDLDSNHFNSFKPLFDKIELLLTD
ncbi:AAA family ATPase [Psychromonas arctica]|uniref:AAA family ATPase n=1 Tax=Psychromonas arctica TaxID=168275 RepID=A0ABU9HD84_9GAMM